MCFTLNQTVEAVMSDLSGVAEKEESSISFNLSESVKTQRHNTDASSKEKILKYRGVHTVKLYSQVKQRLRSQLYVTSYFICSLQMKRSFAKTDTSVCIHFHKIWALKTALASALFFPKMTFICFCD